jgi:hypothetical protein
VMDAASMAVVLAACVTAIASVCVAFITRHHGRKIHETHKQVTVNGGLNDPPTILDKLADIKDELHSLKHNDIQDLRERQIAQDAKLDAHLLWHLDKKD